MDQRLARGFANAVK